MAPSQRWRGKGRRVNAAARPKAAFAGQTRRKAPMAVSPKANSAPQRETKLRGGAVGGRAEGLAVGGDAGTGGVGSGGLSNDPFVENIKQTMHAKKKYSQLVGKIRIENSHPITHHLRPNPRKK